MDGAKTTQDEPESSSREPEPPGGATSPSDITDNRPPLLMQRPPSSGIDITGFSFAKPVSHSLGFSLSGVPKQGRIDPASLGAAIRGMTTSAGAESLKGLFQSSGAASSNAERVPCQVQASSTDRQPFQDTGNNSKGDMKALPNNPAIDVKGDQSNSQRAIGRESWTRKAQPSRPATRPSDVSKVTKFRREGKSTQLSEDKLFELLIAKVKMREEKEAIIADMKEQLEADNAQLKKENQSLRGQTKVYEEQFQNLQTQNSSQERQVGIWKERVLKFKQIVNELGHEFETLRLDSNRLKTTVSSLEDERNDLSRSIDDIKLHIARSERTIDDQQIKLTGYEIKISELDHALLTTRERFEETCSNLTEERKRTNLLESYIQNYSRSQIRQINLIRADNMKLLEKLTTGLENISASSSSARDAVLDEIKSVKEEAQRMLDKEKISARHEMQRNQEEQIDIMQREREKFEECSETLIGQLQGVQGSLTNTKKLIENEQEHRVIMLRESQQQVQHLTKANAEMAIQINSQAAEIRRAQESESTSCLEKNELTIQLRESEQKVLRLMKANTEMVTQINSKTAEIQSFQESESVYCLEKNDLATRLRESEQKVLRLTKANAEIVTQVHSQTAEIQRVQESESASCLEKNDLALNLRESEQKVQHLTKANAEMSTQLNSQTAEIQSFQESESASCLERNDLQERLRQAHERVHELEQKLAATSVNEPLKDDEAGIIVPFSEIQKKLSPERIPSSFYDPGDFAMLFMSDDLCPSSPFNVDSAKHSLINPEKQSQVGEIDQPPARELTNKIGPSPKVHQSPVRPKRKAVNFKPQPTGEMTARTSSARSVMTQVHENPTERPNKMTKHVHKWTYSRIRSSGTEIQHEQPAKVVAGSSLKPAVERRTSPKGRVSASSGNRAPQRKSSRGRGKCRSRGERYSARFSQND